MPWPQRLKFQNKIFDTAILNYHLNKEYSITGSRETKQRQPHQLWNPLPERQPGTDWKSGHWRSFAVHWRQSSSKTLVIKKLSTSVLNSILFFFKIYICSNQVFILSFSFFQCSATISYSFLLQWLNFLCMFWCYIISVSQRTLSFLNLPGVCLLRQPSRNWTLRRLSRLLSVAKTIRALSLSSAWETCRASQWSRLKWRLTLAGLRKLNACTWKWIAGTVAFSGIQKKSPYYLPFKFPVV